MRTSNLPTPFDSVLAVWARNLLQFQKTWIVSLFWIVLEPIFTLGALGYGLGSYISQVQGVSYIEFFFPALLCNATMMVAYFECTYANFTKLSHMKLYQSMLLAPLDVSHLLVGEILWAATKAMFSATGILIVAWIMGAMGSAKVLMAIPVLFLSSLVFASFGMLVTSIVKNYDEIIYPSSGLIIPLSLFSGTYFPLESMPKVVQGLAYLSPLTHAVSATRDLQRGNFSSMLILNICVLILILILILRVAKRKFESRLIS